MASKLLVLFANGHFEVSKVERNFEEGAAPSVIFQFVPQGRKVKTKEEQIIRLAGQFHFGRRQRRSGLTTDSIQPALLRVFVQNERHTEKTSRLLDVSIVVIICTLHRQMPKPITKPIPLNVTFHIKSHFASIFDPLFLAKAVWLVGI